MRSRGARWSAAAITTLFGDVLALSAKAGSVQAGVVAVDGTRIAAAATHHADRDYAQIARKILEEAADADAAEHERFGEARGDGVAEGLRTSAERRTRLREAKQALEANARRPRQAGPARAVAAHGRMATSAAPGRGA